MAEFYFDTPNPIRILKGSNYSYNLQWTQKEPSTTDKVIGYWISVTQVTYNVPASLISVFRFKHELGVLIERCVLEFF